MTTKLKPVVIWGGVDVDPSLYGEDRHPMTQLPNNTRDATELGMIMTAIRAGNPVIGVCRGAQLICVANKGKLHQHTEPHKQSHSLLINDDSIIEMAAAGHHQIMIPNKKVEHVVIATNPNPVKIYAPDGSHIVVKNTAEIVWYPKTKCLAVQPHPEWMKSTDEFVVWLNKLLDKLDIDYSF